MYNTTMIQSLTFNADIRNLWNNLLKQSQFSIPFYSYEWHNLYFATDGKNKQPIILYDPDLQILAAFEKKGKTAAFVGSEITDYSDLIGPEEHKEEAWQSIIKSLLQMGIEDLILTNVPQTSQTYNYFKDKAKERDVTPLIRPLPSSYEEYLKTLSRKDRHELERKQRKFLREYPEVCICTKKGKEADIDVIVSLMKMDQRKLGFLTEEHEAFFRALPEAFPDSFLTMVLYVQNSPATAIVAFQTREAFLLYNSGFDQAHFPGAGFYLKAQSVQYAISHGFKEYNFLRGSERYKYNLGGQNFSVFDISIKLF